MGPEADGSTDHLTLPGCPLPCTLEKFKAWALIHYNYYNYYCVILIYLRFVTSFVPDNFDEECGLSSMPSKLMSMDSRQCRQS